jgi:hypothetical protein
MVAWPMANIRRCIMTTAKTPKTTTKAAKVPRRRSKGSARSQGPTATADSAQVAKSGPSKKKTEKQPGGQRSGKASAVEAALRVLGEAGQPMNCQEMIQAMAAKGYWTSPAGKTPGATLYSSILREIRTKGKEARFTKTARGKFALAQKQ